MNDENMIDQNSLSQDINGIVEEPNEVIDEEIEQVDYHAKSIALFQDIVEHVHQVISRLSEQEEILKETLKIKERQLLDTFKLLDEKKKRMRDLVLEEVNRDQLSLDIGLSEEFQALKRVINNQKKEIDQLKDQLSKQGTNFLLNQGLSGRNNDQDFIRVFTKIPEIEKEIEIGRKFASTQYVRDYFEKPQVYKVAYEQVKYEFQIRAKIKESLEQEKQHYLRKKDQITKATIREKQIEQELLKQKDTLLRQLKSFS